MAIKKRKALIIGINKYPQAELQGCVNDAMEFRDVLMKFYKFTSTNILMLLDEAATKSNIMYNINNLVNGSTDDDILMLFFSGHGTRVIDKQGDEPDGYDECLVPVDFRTNGYIIDDSLHKIIKDKLDPDADLDIFLDSCFSGSATHSVDGGSKRFYPSADEEKIKSLGLNVRVPVAVSSMKEIRWSACRSNETCWEANVETGGIVRGVFTYVLCQKLRIQWQHGHNRYHTGESVAYNVTKDFAKGQHPILTANQKKLQNIIRGW